MVHTSSTKHKELEEVAAARDYMKLVAASKDTKHPEVLSSIIERSRNFSMTERIQILGSAASNTYATTGNLQRIFELNEKHNISVFADIARHINVSAEIQEGILYVITPDKNRQLNFEVLLAIAKNKNTNDTALSRIILGIGPVTFLNRDSELMEAVASNPNVSKRTLLHASLLACTTLHVHAIGNNFFDGFWTALANAEVYKDLLGKIPGWATSEAARKAITERLQTNLLR